MEMRDNCSCFSSSIMWVLRIECHRIEVLELLNFLSSSANVIFASFLGSYFSVQREDLVLLSCLLQSPGRPPSRLKAFSTSNDALWLSPSIYTCMQIQPLVLIDIFTQNLRNTTRWSAFELSMLALPHSSHTPVNFFLSHLCPSARSSVT